MVIFNKVKIGHKKLFSEIFGLFFDRENTLLKLTKESLFSAFFFFLFSLL